MKWLKWLLVTTMILSAGLGLAGCSDDDDDDGDSNPLGGTWGGTAFNGQALPDGIGMSITLRSNGTATSTTTINGASETFSGTWSASSGTLTVVDEDGTESMGYTVEGNTLTLTDETGAYTFARS